MRILREYGYPLEPQRCAKLLRLTARIGLACARRIAAPPRTMVAMTNLRAGVELSEANPPGDGRETACDSFQRLLAVRERGGRLRHPPAANGLEAGVWRVRPIVGDLPFRELRQDQRDPKQLVRLPSQALQSPKQPRAGTAAPWRSDNAEIRASILRTAFGGPCGCCESVL